MQCVSYLGTGALGRWGTVLVTRCCPEEVQRQQCTHPPGCPHPRVTTHQPGKPLTQNAIESVAAAMGPALRVAVVLGAVLRVAAVQHAADLTGRLRSRLARGRQVAGPATQPVRRYDCMVQEQGRLTS